MNKDDILETVKDKMSATRSHLSRAMTMPKSSTGIKLVGIGAAAGIIGGLGYYFITQETGAVGGSCTTKGTPCYSAMSPYKKAWASCYNSWNIVNNATLKQGYVTTGQQQLLTGYSQCMNYNAGEIYKVAASFKPPNIMTTLAGVFGPILTDGVIALGGIAALRVLTSYILDSKGAIYLSQTAVRSASEQSTIQGQADNGTLSPEEAANAEKMINSETSTLSDAQAAVAAEIQADGEILNLTNEEMAAAEESINTTIVSDTTMSETEDILASV